MRDAQYSFYIDGNLVNNPIDWQEIQVLSTFDNDSVQNNVSTSEIVFPLSAAKQIKQWVVDGTGNGVGIFEGIPFQIVVSNGSNSTLVGDYILDFETYRETEDRKVAISFRFKDGLNQLSDRLEAITFGWLESEGKITNADYVEIKYVVQKKNEVLEIITLAFITAFLAKTLADSIQETADAIAQISSKSATGLFGPVGALIYSIAVALILAAKAVAILIALTKLFGQLFQAFQPIARKAKTMRLSTMLEKVGEYLGYTIETNIPLENYVYLPSNTSGDVLNQSGFVIIPKGVQKGIPNSGDYGYSLLEFMELLKKLFNAKFAVVGTTLQFRNIDDPYWVEQSGFTLRPDTFIAEKSYNNNDLKANKLISFRTDVTDEWTITEFKGTNYEIVTRPITVKDQKNVLIRGLERIDIPLALGSRKDGTSPFEAVLKAIAASADSISKVFGGNSNYVKAIEANNKVLRVSNNNYTVPKLLYYTTSLPENHRELLSAKRLYEDYYATSSFTINYRGQKSIYTGVRIPFGYEDWLLVSNNSYIRDFEGREAKITNLQWSVGSDYAVVDFWVREPYTFNLMEDYIEAE